MTLKPINKKGFIDYVLNLRTAPPPSGPSGFSSAIPGGFDDFDDFDGGDKATAAAAPDPGDFARGLLERCFGDTDKLPISNILIPSDAADEKRLETEYVPGAHYWKKSTKRSFHVVLVRLKQTGSGILGGSHKRTVRELSLLEDLLHRRLQDGLVWFEKGGHRRTPEMPQGSQEETLYVVSITDDRPGGDPRQLVCFGTKAKATNALEIFVLREEVLDWDPALAREHLGAFYKRHVQPLVKGKNWQEAFVTGKERKKAKKLINACEKLIVDEKEFRDSILELLDEIASNFGLTPEKGKRVKLQQLPANHSIGINPPDACKKDFENSFQAIRVFDVEERLLGYIVYVVDGKTEADQLKEQLQKHNHFHNVLVVYPHELDTKLELWQGDQPLEGSLRGNKKASQFNGEGGIIQLLSRFFIVSRTEIQEPKKLAVELAWRAQHLKNIALEELEKEKTRPKNKRPLRDLLNIFNQALVALDEEEFADAYAQTITYGLLAARWLSSDRHDLHFARKNIYELLPTTSPFLQELFQRLVNSHFDQNLSWLLDDITSILSRTMIAEVFRGERDPSIHFYEDFLDIYDPMIRKTRGVYYTPDEVVSFIVNSVDKSLVEDLGLARGLADTTSWKDYLNVNRVEIPTGVDAKEPVVQILDPAVGTGTFLLKVLEVIYQNLSTEYSANGMSEEQALSAWRSYVRKYLLPRLNGFELMMAPYIVSHLRIGLALQETGFTFSKDDRLRIFLTNSLEQKIDPQILLIGEHVAKEAKEAELIKVGGSISVIIGNPPYSKMSGSLSKDAVSWVNPFRYVDGDKIRDKGALAFELNIQDDYVKFWGFLIGLLNRSPVGVGNYITNSRFLSSRSLRGMRQHLSLTASKILVLDLGGQISERSGTAELDENVFNIAQGVAITRLVRGPEKKDCVVGYQRMWGDRSNKLAELSQHDFKWNLSWVSLKSPLYSFLSDGSDFLEYETWSSLEELMPFNSGSIITSRDALCISEDSSTLLSNIERFSQSEHTDTVLQSEIGFSVKKSWNVEAAKKTIRNFTKLDDKLKRILYRPFDYRFIFYEPSLIDTPSKPVCSSVFGLDNWVLLTPRVKTTDTFNHILLSRTAAEKKSCSHDRATQMFPLYKYRASLSGNRVENLRVDLLIGDNSADIEHFQAVDVRFWIFFIYAVLHSPSYRARYGNQAREGYPRIPAITSFQLFDALSEIGEELAVAHSLDSISYESKDSEPRRSCPQNLFVKKPTFDTETIWLDKKNGQGFVDVKETTWNFKIGGYAVLQKWLKGRKNRALTCQELDWFLRMIDVVEETQQKMALIDEVIEKYGGWPGAFQSKGKQK